MDVKAILGLLASPTVLAGVGGYLGYKYGKKASIQNKYVAGGVGVGAGWLIGKTLQQFTQPPAVVPQIPDIEQQSAQGDYVDLDLNAPGQPMALPAPQNPWDQFQQAPPTPQFSSSPANEHAGEGSYTKTSYNVEGVEDAMNEAEMMLELQKKNGSN